MKLTLNAILVSVLTISFVACKKDKDVVDPGPPGPLPGLSVKLNQPYLTAAQVDSAFAIWKINGEEQRIRMNLRNDSLIADINLFNEGNGVLTLHIFSNKKYSNQYLSQFISRKTISIQRTSALNYNGPASFHDVAWLPRVKLKDAAGHEVIIAMRPDDPFFLVKDPGHQVVNYVVNRSYWKTIGGIQLAGESTWECTTGCTDTANEEFFTTLPQRIGTKPWNHVSIAILFEIDNNGAWVLSLEHDL